MSYLPSLEAISYQHDSKLFVRLTEVFRELMDYRDKIESKLPKSGISIDLTVKKHLAVEKFFKSKIADKFKKVVKKEVGIDITKLNMLSVTNACGMFAVVIDNNALVDPSNYYDMMDILSGKKEYKKGEDVDLDKFFQLHKTLNKKLSKVNLKKAKYGLKSTMIIDIGTALFADELSIIGRKEDRLLPEELAAIYTHEIGHVVTVIEQTQNLCYAGAYLSKEVEKISRIVKKDLLGFLEKNKDTLTTHIDNISNSISKKSNSGSLINIIIEFIKKLLNVKLDKKQKRYLMYVANLIYVLVFQVVFFLVMFMNIQMLFRFGFQHYFPPQLIAFVFGLELFDVAEKPLYSSSVKSSREIYTRRNNYMIERLADEFVSLHGASPYLASGLAKIHKFFEGQLYTLGNTVNPIFKQNLLVKQFATVVGFFNKFCMTRAFIIEPKSYERKIDRLKRLVQNDLNILRDEKLPPQARSYIANNITKTLKIIEDEKRINTMDDLLIKWRDVHVFIKDILIGSIPAFIDMIATGRIHKDYEKFLNNVDDLIGNKMFHASAQIDQFIDDLK